MKTIIFYICLLPLYFCSLYGQNESVSAITITNTKSFDLDVFKLDKASDSLALTLILNITATYSKKDGDEKLKICLDDSCTDSFILKYPVNFNELSGHFNANKQIAGYESSKMFMSSRGLLKIHYWLNNFSSNLIAAPLSGILHLKPLVKVYTNYDATHQDLADEWLIQMNSLSEEIQNFNESITKSGLRERVNSKKESIKKIESEYQVNKKVMDSFKLIDSTIKKNSSTDSLKNILTEYNMKLKYIYDSLNYYPNSYYMSQSYRNSIFEIEKKLNKSKKNENSFTELKDFLTRQSDSLLSRFKKEKSTIISELEGLKKELKEKESKVEMYAKQLAKLKLDIYDNGYYFVSDISVQFERGFLEKVNIVLNNDKHQALLFENYYAIGFTSPFNFRNLNQTRLFLRIDRNAERANNYIYLGDVISNYFNELDNYTRDYSPADTTVKHIDPRKTPLVNLHRSRRVDLLDAKIYTDLLGLADKNPNGILQTEITKRANIFTYRFLSKFKTNYGFLNYIDFEGSISKFEQKQRYLMLRNENMFVNNQITSPSYATMIDFMRYQTMGVGATANICVFDVPEGKYTFTLDLGARYNRIPVADSLRKFVNGNYSSTVNTDLPAAGMITWFPKLKFELFAERRYGFHLAWTRNYSNLFTNNQYKYIKSYEKSDLSSLSIDPVSKVTHTIEFYARFEPNPSDASSKLFFRTRFNFQKGDVNTFFTQIQVGYAYNLVYKK
jgi:hypothetical protein